MSPCTGAVAHGMSAPLPPLVLSMLCREGGKVLSMQCKIGAANTGDIYVCHAVWGESGGGACESVYLVKMRAWSEHSWQLVGGTQSSVERLGHRERRHAHKSKLLLRCLA
jgi:hypothetical protein